jgi:superfamily II DNA or RNA helicase
MSLTMARIMSAASDLKTFSRGLENFNDRLVKNYSVIKTEQGEEIRAVVGGKDPYEVQVCMTGRGDIRSRHCSCPAYDTYSGACEHIVAVLIHHCRGGQLSGKQAAREKQKKREESPDPAAPAPIPQRRAAMTDGVARLMLNKYIFHENAEIVGQSFADDEKVTLTPFVRRSTDSDLPYVEFTIGITRHYIVKDVFELVDNVKTLDKVAYGKQLEFIHSMDSFDEDSKRLLRFVMDKCEEIRVYSRLLAEKPSSEINMDRRRLRLSPGNMDRFFSMYEGKEIMASLDFGPERMSRIVAENPILDIRLAARDDGTVVLSAEPFGFAGGESHLYIQRDDRIYKCDENYTAKTRDFLRALEKCSFNMKISKTDLPTFCSNVLPAVRGFIGFSGDVSALEEHMPLPLETEIYLDAPEKNVITASMIYCYGDKRIDHYALHFAGKTPDIGRRDLRGEMKVRVLISKYFQYYDTNNKLLRLEADDEGIYHFISEGVPALMELATVHVTDRFRKIGIILPPKITIGVSLAGNLLELDLDTGEFPRDELLGVLDAYRENRKYYRLSDGRYIRMERGALSGLAQIADGLELSRRQLVSGKVRVPGFRVLYLDRILHENEEIRFNRDKHYKELVRNIKSVEDSDLVIPKDLARVLRNYQKTGFRWLKTLEKYNLGGILADDMGLGKTLQVIALILSAKEEGVSIPSIVVCPASLALNWESEIGRFAPSLKVATVIGDTNTRKELICSSDKYDVLITSYDMLKRDIELYSDKEFHYGIIDEAQYIKNHSTQNAKSVKAIKARHRFALTGTPIENRLSELWSIFDYLMPGYLYGYQKFKKRFEIPAVRNQDRHALEQLKKMTAPFILRRLKSEVLSELPPKIDTVLRTTMEGEQRKLYLANTSVIRKMLAGEPEDVFERRRFHILAMLTKLRQICCDPSLCYENYDGPNAKLDICMELLHESIEGGHKVLLFSQFTSILAIIEEKLVEEGISYYVLKGDTPKDKRAQLVDRFNNDSTRVFLISLRAGGTGLNLTGADVVIHYDPWWNIAAQNQATDRSHRIGQKNSVQVYRLVIKDSIEEKILKLQESKKELAESVISEQHGSATGFTITKEELLELLS